MIKNYNSQLFVNEYDDNEGDEHDDDSDDSDDSDDGDDGDDGGVLFRVGGYRVEYAVSIKKVGLNKPIEKKKSY